MQLLLTHHKNQQSWKQAPIHFEIPTELAQLLLTWLEGAHKELCLYHLPIGDPAYAPCMPLCVHGQAWGRLEHQRLEEVVDALVKAHGGVEHLPPSTCRHMFVDERRSYGMADEPQDKGASMAMGNSLKAWDKHYDRQRHFHPKDCQAAVNAMDI